jgi:hypothetical protein
MGPTKKPAWERPHQQLKTTHGKNGVPELPAVFDHIAYSPLAVFFMDPNEPRLVTQIAIACMVSDADLRDN